jgi:hypothetical protein
MTTKPVRAGGEIVSWCTKCKMDLMHRIVALVGDEVKRVECITCGSVHNFRKPKTEPVPTKTRTVVVKGEGPSGPTKIVTARTVGGAPKAERAPREAKPKRTTEAQAAAARTERANRETWERAIAGQPTDAFSPYRVSEVFVVNQLVRHTKFGDGVVTRIIDADKVEIVFEDAARTMGQGVVPT